MGHGDILAGRTTTPVAPPRPQSQAVVAHRKFSAAHKQFSIKRTITINKSHCAKSQFHLHELSLTWLGFSLVQQFSAVFHAIFRGQCRRGGMRDAVGGTAQ